MLADRDFVKVWSEYGKNVLLRRRSAASFIVVIWGTYLPTANSNPSVCRPCTIMYDPCSLPCLLRCDDVADDLAGEDHEHAHLRISAMQRFMRQHSSLYEHTTSRIALVECFNAKR